jgi:hypothetical protein
MWIEFPGSQPTNRLCSEAIVKFLDWPRGCKYNRSKHWDSDRADIDEVALGAGEEANAGRRTCHATPFKAVVKCKTVDPLTPFLKELQF